MAAPTFMIIKYATSDIIAFEIDGEIWYLCLIGIPHIYNKDLKRQIIPNIDNWIQAKTKQRYGYASICDMATAFAMGMECSYTSQDIAQISMSISQKILNTIFKGPYIHIYNKLYWIEMLSPSKIVKNQKIISENFTHLVHEIGNNQLYKYLCRFRKACIYLNVDYSVFEKLIRKMGLEPQEPQYPNSSKIDNEVIQQHIMNIPYYKNVDPKIIMNIEKLKQQHV